MHDFVPSLTFVQSSKKRGKLEKRHQLTTPMTQPNTPAISIHLVFVIYSVRNITRTYNRAIYIYRARKKWTKTNDWGMAIARLHFRRTWKAHIYDIRIVLIWFHFELPQEQHFDYFTLHHSGILWHSVREEPGVIFYLGCWFCCLMRVISRNIIWQFQFSYSYSHFVFTFFVHFHRYSSFVAQ